MQRLAPLDALAHAVLECYVEPTEACTILEAFKREFVDYNEFRVATDLELESIFKNPSQKAKKALAHLRNLLAEIFQVEGALTFARIEKLPRDQAADFLRRLRESNAYITGSVLMYGLGHPSVPVGPKLMSMLKSKKWVRNDADEWSVQQLLEQLVPEPDRHRFHQHVVGGAVPGGKK